MRRREYRLPEELSYAANSSCLSASEARVRGAQKLRCSLLVLAQPTDRVDVLPKHSRKAELREAPIFLW